MPPPEPRTKRNALEVLLALVPETRPDLTDEGARALFTEQLVRDVFAEAWKTQFDDNRASFRRSIKAIVDEVIADQSLGEEEGE